jgi:hypothetical protein
MSGSQGHLFLPDQNFSADIPPHDTANARSARFPQDGCPIILSYAAVSEIRREISRQREVSDEQFGAVYGGAEK